ncbi:PDDEXK nuclease domain-containing protein [Selenomonas sp. AB3002]|uniref:PDDEXK nuclease domain-containing protein n=1 Tax=Selenomonas sp. AB3002 TaxID=1392502 RepID=UPI000496B899
MSGLLTKDLAYKQWVQSLSKKFRQSQIKAAVKVNREMLAFYWELGRDIVEMKAESRWGSGFIDDLSKDLQQELPTIKGWSPTNLRYIKRFYQLYSPLIQSQVVPKLASTEIQSQVVTELDMESLFSIPWGHHRNIISKCQGNSAKAVFYIKQTIENGWSRAVLLNFLDTDLYERQGKAVTNFASILPPEQSELAQEITKDPYNFDFLTLTANYHEKELKDALMDNITKFLLELGKGFAFVGREYRLTVGKTEQFIDLLFYHIKLRSYVVIEVKVTEFEPRDIGQVSTYVAAVDGMLRGEGDGQTIGLLICKTKDEVLAKYATVGVNLPIGISEYELSKLLPEEFKGTLPTIEEIESELR